MLRQKVLTSNQTILHIKYSKVVLSINKKITLLRIIWQVISRHSGFFIVNFEHIFQLALVFLLLTLKIKFPAGLVLK